MERKILRTAIFIAMSFLPFLASCKKEAEKDKGPKAVLISIDKTEAELEMYSELRLEATVYPTEQKFTVNWKSEDEGVATVDAEGVVRGVSLGTVKIKASVAGLAKTAECLVNIKKASVSIELDKQELSMEYGSTYTLKPSLSKNFENIEVKWSSTNENVATVDNNGKVTARKPGNTVIKVEVPDGFFSPVSAECKVKITRASLSIGLDKKELRMKEYGSTYTLKPSLSKNFENIGVKWSSSNENVATVDNNGKVTTRRPGKAVIKVEVVSDFFSLVSAKCKLDVFRKYIADNYDYGESIRIGNLVWAPVNCGYDKFTFKGGKHYQWGRKAGHEYVDMLSSGTYFFVKDGPVDAEDDKVWENWFIKMPFDKTDWFMGGVSSSRWNAGTEDNPIKTKNDPCPEGWRVPTAKELRQLAGYYRKYEDNGSSLDRLKFQDDEGNTLFLPVNGAIFNDGTGRGRGDKFCVYSSSYLKYDSSKKERYVECLVNGLNMGMMTRKISAGHSIRCILE